MSPNNLCNITRHFLFFPNVTMSLFYKTLMSLSTVFIKDCKGPCWISTTFKVAVSHFVFYPCASGALLYNVQVHHVFISRNCSIVFPKAHLSLYIISVHKLEHLCSTGSSFQM